MVKAKKSRKSKDNEFLKKLDVYTCDVSEDNVFYCADGDSFKNVGEFNNSLKTMDEATFISHVNSDKNDFATWIYDVVGDVHLAGVLRGIDNLEDTRNEVNVRIEYLGSLNL
jgi:hypothetical protein